MPRPTPPSRRKSWLTRPARWPLRCLGLRLVTPVGDSNQEITSGRPPCRLPPAGRWRWSRISSQKGSRPPSDRRAARPIGCQLYLTSKPWMHPASSIAARSPPTTPLASVTGSPESPREMDSCLLRLPDRRLLSLSSRRPDQSVPYKTNSRRSMEPMLCLPAWLMTGTADGNNNKKCRQWPPVLRISCISLRSLSAGAGPTTRK